MSTGQWISQRTLCLGNIGGMAKVGVGTGWVVLGCTAPRLLGGMAGARVDIGWGCPIVHCIRATLGDDHSWCGPGAWGSWDGLGRLARVPGPCSYLCYQGGGERQKVALSQKLVPPTPERVPAVLYLFGRCSRVSKWIFFMYSLGAL